MIRLAIFASGEGTNAQSFIDYFKSSNDVVISLIVSGNSSAKVLERAANAGIPYIVVSRHWSVISSKPAAVISQPDEFIDFLKEQADFIVLAGFMWIIPENLIKVFPNKIVNIHPALLPKYGGKGMYGNKVHEAVIANHEKNSGITIHYVNEKYDEGKIIFQKECEVKKEDTPISLAARVHELEHKYYPITVGKLVRL